MERSGTGLKSGLRLRLNTLGAVRPALLLFIRPRLSFGVPENSRGRMLIHGGLCGAVAEQKPTLANDGERVLHGLFLMCIRQK